MKTKSILIILTFIALQACEYSKSANKDFLSGITTTGNGLSAANVYLTVDKETTTETSFIYGSTFYVNFNDMLGFKKENNFVFPGMRLEIVSEAGDTVLQNADLYADGTDGYDVSPLLLDAHVTVASPIMSKQKYKVYINIWDKKGEGTFNASMNFDVVPNDKIKIESAGVTYDNIYLFNEKSGATITDNKINLNENIYLLFEGLKGFTEEDGKSFIGVSLKASDASGTVIIDEKDLMGDEGMDLTELHKQVAPNFIFSGDKVQTPLKCIIIIWDKKSDAKITASVDLGLK